MDQIIKVRGTGNGGQPNEGKDEQVQPGPAVNTHSKIADKSSTEKIEKSLFEKVKDRIMETVNPPLPPLTATLSSSDVPSKFSIGDRVVIQTADNVPVRGVVQWARPMKMSKSAGGIVIPVVGIETVSYNVVYCFIDDRISRKFCVAKHLIFSILYN